MKLGCVFIILTFLIPAIAFMPLLIAPSDMPAPIRGVLTTLICGSDEELVRETYRESYHRPGEVGININCRNENGVIRDATGNFVILVMGSIVLPTLALIGYAIIKSKNMVNHVIQQNRHIGTTFNTTTHNLSVDEFDKIKGSLGLGNLDINELTKGSTTNVSNATNSLVTQLKDLEQAYEKRLITREEYDDARRRILDNMGN